MKAIRYVVILLIGVLVLAACDKYLDKTPAASVTDKEVFGTYASFQGFVDPNYGEVINYNTMYSTTTMDCGGETINNFISWSPAFVAWTGDYWYLSGQTAYSYNDMTSLFANAKYGYGIYYNVSGGIWTGGWRGIRRCNVALSKLNLLSDATAEERQLIEGQLYFFRAYFHHQIIDAFGGMPYVDTVYSPSDEMKLPRLTYQQTAEKIVKDYDRAIALLPVNWDNTTVGGQRPGANTGRATQGAAMAYKAKVLLYAGSPLMNKYSGNDYVYNTEYCQRAAAAGWEMIQLANSGAYSLLQWAKYSDNFYKQDGTMPWTTETIWQRVSRTYGSTDLEFIKRQMSFSRMGGRYGEQVNQLYVDKFEMADGTRYQTSYDNDNVKRWNSRDPRFRKSIIVDRDQHGLDSRSIIYLFTGAGTPATDKSTAQQISLPYLMKKYWPVGANGYDNVYSQLRITNPLMRLAEVYLDYAEAVTAAYGATGSAPGSGFTAVDALNAVRTRAGMPAATAAAPGYANFMDLVRNERNVEFCFEGQYWYDIRRWYIAHLPENLQCVDLIFDKAWTTFNRSVFKTKVFENPKHYWLPINKDQTLLYPGFYQNPGWQ